MPRGPNHLHDSSFDAPLYRQFDVEDLTRMVGYMRAIGLSARIPVADLRHAMRAIHQAHPWGYTRMTRILRVGVELEWLIQEGRGQTARYSITPTAPTTFDPIRITAQQVGRDVEEARDEIIAVFKTLLGLADRCDPLVEEARRATLEKA